MKKVLIFLILIFSNHIIAQNFSDASGAITLSDKSEYTLHVLDGAGEFNQEIKNTSCTKKYFKEHNSAWFKWSVSKAGDLSFVITPHTIEDDIDFIVFKMEENDSYDLKKEIRCMASGEQLYSIGSNEACKGVTGLRRLSSDEKESVGCQSSDDNFLKALDVQEGDHYLLFVNNYSSTNGFTISFDGTAEINQRNDFAMSLYPNPSSGSTEIALVSQVSMSTNLEVFNSLGKRIYKKGLEVVEGEQVIDLNLEEFSPGSYTVSVRIKDKVLSKKLIIHP